MSHRERPAQRGPAVHPSAPAGNGKPTNGHPAVAWDELYDRLPSDQRMRVLAAAAAGVVAADQVPPPPTSPPPHLLHRLLTGDGPPDFHSLGGPEFTDDSPEDLDSAQRSAISLALRTPDIALIQGRSGAGLEQVAAATAAAAARRGERVLLVAASPAALDRILNLLAARPEVCAVRCVGRDEKEADLTPVAAGCTFAAHTRRLTEQAREHARTRIAECIEQCRRRDAEATTYDHLLDLAEQHYRLQTRRAELPALRDGIAAAVESTLAEPTDADRERAAALARFDADLTARQSDVASARRAVADLDGPLAALRLLGAARSAGRWWTPTWWQARFAGDLPTQLSELEAKHRQAATYAATIDDEVARIAKARADLTAEHDRGREARRQAELDRRRTELDDLAVALDRELTLVTDKWQQAVQQIPADGPRPHELSPQAAAACRDEWGRSREADRRDLEFARAWADGLEPLLEALPGRLLEAVNLVAATPAALAADRHFGDARRGMFDLLLVIEAPALADGDLLAAARRARRWVLLGEPQSAETRDTRHETRDTSKNKRHHHQGPVSRVSSSVSGFNRLWQLLHCDPWGREGGRVVCRLRPVPPDRRGRLDREPVADRPDVELRIHTPPAGPPELAEVAFPAGTAISRAVEYVFEQLGELPASLSAECRVLSAELHSLTTMSVGLADGVRAVIADAPGGWEVFAVEFNPTAGWDRERAAAWVRRHLVQHGPGRTIRLSSREPHP